MTWVVKPWIWNSRNKYELANLKSFKVCLGLFFIYICITLEFYVEFWWSGFFQNKETVTDEEVYVIYAKEEWVSEWVIKLTKLSISHTMLPLMIKLPVLKKKYIIWLYIINLWKQCKNNKITAVKTTRMTFISWKKNNSNSLFSK